MNHELIELYIGRVLRLAELPKDREAEVREEITSHLSEATEKLMKTGLNSKDATWKAIKQYGHPRVVGSRLRRPWQWVDIRSYGTARGFIAMGPRAIGVFAFGAVAIGVFPVGGLAIGVMGLGGLAIGLMAWGGFTIGAVAYGGFNIGIVAAGGVAYALVGKAGLTYALLCPVTSKSAVIHSYYTMANAPEYLKALLPLFEIPAFMNRNLWFFMPLLAILSFVPSILMYYMGLKRSLDAPNTPENWLLE